MDWILQINMAMSFQKYLKEAWQAVLERTKVYFSKTLKRKAYRMGHYVTAFRGPYEKHQWLRDKNNPPRLTLFAEFDPDFFIDGRLDDKELESALDSMSIRFHIRDSNDMYTHKGLEFPLSTIGDHDYSIAISGDGLNAYLMCKRGSLMLCQIAFGHHQEQHIPQTFLKYFRRMKEYAHDIGNLLVEKTA
jgi:hypothetical protein